MHRHQRQLTQTLSQCSSALKFLMKGLKNPAFIYIFIGQLVRERSQFRDILHQQTLALMTGLICLSLSQLPELVIHPLTFLIARTRLSSLFCNGFKKIHYLKLALIYTTAGTDSIRSDLNLKQAITKQH